MIINMENQIKKKDKKEVIRQCPSCKQDIKIKRGLNAENIKRLFRKPSIEDMIILFILFMTIVSFLIYIGEIKAYQAYIADNCPFGQNEQIDDEIYLPSTDLNVNSSNSNSNEDS